MTLKKAFSLNLLESKLALGSNILALIGVIFLKWAPIMLLAAFWMENIIIGFINILKMSVFNVGKGCVVAGIKIVMVLFFAGHYGAFLYGHGTFLLEFDSYSDANGVFEFLSFYLQNRYEFVFVGILFISHAIPFIRDYIIRPLKHDKDAPGQNPENFNFLMVQPYLRVMVLHVALIVGLVLVNLIGSPMAASIVFLFLKMALELFNINIGNSLFQKINKTNTETVA